MRVGSFVCKQRVEMNVLCMYVCLCMYEICVTLAAKRVHTCMHRCPRQVGRRRFQAVVVTAEAHNRLVQRTQLELARACLPEGSLALLLQVDNRVAFATLVVGGEPPRPSPGCRSSPQCGSGSW